MLEDTGLGFGNRELDWLQGAEDRKEEETESEGEEDGAENGAKDGVKDGVKGGVERVAHQIAETKVCLPCLGYNNRLFPGILPQYRILPLLPQYWTEHGDCKAAYSPANND